MPTPQKQGVLPAFWGHVEAVGSESGHIVGSGLHWLANTTKSMIEAPPKFGTALGNLTVDKLTGQDQAAQNQELGQKVDTLIAQYKRGDINAKQYALELKDINQSYGELIKAENGTQANLNHDGTNLQTSGINTASDILTIITAGFSQAAPELTVASRYLMSSSAGAKGIDAVASGIGKLATDEALMKSLPTEAQNVIKSATTEVIMNSSGNMVASDIAKTAAVNLALKYPIYFAAISSTGKQLYTELQKQEYGRAVNTLGFNAALILGGGAVGEGLRIMGKTLGGLSDATFGRTTFIDTLSKGIGDGDPAGLFKAVNETQDPALRSEYIKALSAEEATNASVRNSDPVAGAYRILDAYKGMDGLDPTTQTHQQYLETALNHYKAQQLADVVSKQYGLGQVTVGRTSVGVLRSIADTVASEPTLEGRQAAFKSYLVQYPDGTAANNANLQRQITHAIDTHANASVLRDEIANIKASTTIKGFPAAEAKLMAKLGYTPIKPLSIEAPFREGTGELKSQFASNEEGFIRSVQPLPVLESVGNALIKSGLSPNVANQRVYDVFNTNVASKLDEIGFIKGYAQRLASEQTAVLAKAAPKAEETFGMTKDELKAARAAGMTDEMLAKSKVEGEAVKTAEEAPVKTVVPMTPKETSDYVIKKLSNYAKNPTRGGFTGKNIRPPMTDLRQLTNKDVQTALGVSSKTATEIQGAIMDTFIEVPSSISGLGDKIMSYNFKYNPTARPYSRMQGAFRFSWNPVFKAKLAYKAEFLTQATTGGKFPTFLGTNTFQKFFFGAKYKQLDSIAKTLNEGFTEAGGGAEAADTTAGALKGIGGKYPQSAMRSVAGLVKQMSDNAGLNPEEFMRQFPQETHDAVQTVLGYNPRANFLNSPLARTLNMAFFPFRFEVKVATIMTQSVGKMDPLSQFAVVKGMLGAKQFLNSPQGQAWYSQNADVIGLFEYFSPVATLSSVAEALGTKPHSIQQYGEFGGLPFGWIPTLLDSVGLTHFGQSYVNPKTGVISQDYVPKSARGAANTAIIDLMGSLFTYPGTVVGLPSKTSLESKVATGITGSSTRTDFNVVTPGITPEQQNFQQVVQAHAPAQQLPPTTPPQGSTVQRVPAQATPITVPKAKAGSGTAKKKKADYTPALLPGQSTLGQL